MIPDVIAILFGVVPFLSLVYVFAGHGENPLWGNVVATGLGFLIAAMVAIWFVNGTIVSPSIVSNATYQLPADLSMGEMLSQQQNVSEDVNKLGPGGTGMFSRASISGSQGSLINQTTVTVHSYDMVYQQFHSTELMILYMGLCVGNVILFALAILSLRDAINERENYDEYIDGA